MPEGPTIKILQEELQPFIGRRITVAKGYAKGLKPHELEGHTITDIKTWGKHLLICLGKKLTVRVHMGLFGSYRINSHGKRNASLGLRLGDDEVNFYISNIKLITEPLDEVYDWTPDVMNPKFDVKKTRKKLQEHPKAMICDLLLDQDIFAGSGNIVKNEVLFRARVHPESTIEGLPTRKLTQIINATVDFCADFYHWKKQQTLNKHLEAYEQDECPRNHIPFKKADLGKTKRHCYYCEVCQVRYDTRYLTENK